MTEVPFHVTRLGRTYYEHQVPKLLRQLARLNKNVEALTQPASGAGPAAEARQISRIGPDDRVWLVVDPSGDGGLSDVLLETDLRGLFQAVLGGLDPAQTPTLFTDEEEARAEARKRLDLRSGQV